MRDAIIILVFLSGLALLPVILAVLDTIERRLP